MKDWSDRSGFDWSELLIEQPQFAKYCDWSKFSGWHWDDLHRQQPLLREFIDQNKDHYLLMKGVG